jgi:hypothetical protein
MRLSGNRVALAVMLIAVLAAILFGSSSLRAVGLTSSFSS